MTSMQPAQAREAAGGKAEEGFGRKEIFLGLLTAIAEFILTFFKKHLEDSLGEVPAFLLLVSPLLGYALFVLIKLINKRVIDRVRFAFEEMITRHDQTITDSLSNTVHHEFRPDIARMFDEGISKHDAAITPTLESLSKTVRDLSAQLSEKSLGERYETMIVEIKEMIERQDKDTTSRFTGMLTKHDETLTAKLGTALKEIGDKVDAIEFPKEKFDRLKTKYDVEPLKSKYDVELRPVRIQKYSDPSGFHRVKIGLINGVGDSVYATYLIERHSSLPLETDDEKNYFEGNKEAYNRIKERHRLDKDSRKYTIHRIFIISQDALDSHEKRHEIAPRIERHMSAGFSVKIVKKEELDEKLRLEFAIFDDEIVYELRIGPLGEGFRKGTLYFDDAVVQGYYKEIYREIDSRSLAVEEFWRRHPPRPE